jgi:hypothetical protein
MRLSIALGALAGGLGLGWAALAAADAPPPPAAPIFYCPAASGAKAATAAPAKSCPPAAHAASTAPAAQPSSAHRREEARHEPRHAQGSWVAHEAPPPRYAHEAPRDDVSASQAFIYRYERASHGLNAEAANEAWAQPEGPPPNYRDDRRVHEREYAEAARPMPPVVAPLPPPAPPEHVIVQPAPPPPVVVEVAPTPPARVYVERMAPPPPPPPVYVPACPDRCPRAEEHEGWREHHDYDQSAPPAYSHHEEHYGYVAPQAPPARVYERHEEHYGYVNAPPAYAEREEARGGQTYSYERRETEQSSGWRDSDGHHGYAERHAERRGPCPPSPDHGCSADSPDGRWQDGSYGAVYQYSGRDAYGFLVWPGKN